MSRAADVAYQDAADLADLLDYLTEKRRGWRNVGACNSEAVNCRIFWSTRPDDVEASRRICRRCPVVADCAEYGAEQDDGRGHPRWAGFAARQLRKWRDGKTFEWRQLMKGRIPNA